SKGQLLCHTSLPLFGDETEDVFLTQDEKLLVVELEFRAGVLLEQDAVALFEVHRDALAGVGVAIAGSDGKDAALLGLLLGGVRQDDPTLGDLLALEGLDHDTGSERLELGLRLGIRLWCGCYCHCLSPLFELFWARRTAADPRIRISTRR